MLTTGSWPTQSGARCNLPRELERGCEDFKAFYLASHSGRKLSWQTNMGNAGALCKITCSPCQILRDSHGSILSFVPESHEEASVRAVAGR